MPGYKLGSGSLKELAGVHPELVAVVKLAIQWTAQDFSVHDGLRTLDEQKRLVAAGASQTLDSRHVSGHAVDLLPSINGKPRWEWAPMYVIADAMRSAARHLGTPLRWGGAWDIDFTSSVASPEDLVAQYATRRRDQGLRPFIDGPHYELPASKYPA
jgi:peptidoglycan L-alanyl-D-glutamate endopeptidase CwlK